MRKRFLGICTAVAAIAISMIAVMPQAMAAASKDYAPIPETWKAVKIGNYWFKGSAEKFAFSELKKGKYIQRSYLDIVMGKDTGAPAYTNGEWLFFIKKHKGFFLTGCDLSYEKEGKRNAVSVRIDQLPMEEYENTTMDIAYIRGKYIFLHSDNTGTQKHTLYSFNFTKRLSIKPEELKDYVALSDAKIIGYSGNYVVVEHGYRTDVSPVELSIYRQAKGKLKKVKSLGKYCYGGKVSGGYVYYVASDNPDMKGASLYRLKVNGSGRKTITSTTRTVQYAGDFNDKTCKIAVEGKTYRVTYKNGKWKALK